MLNWFDLVTLLFLLIAFVNGYRKGLVMMLAGLATVILAAIFGGKLAVIIQPSLQQFFGSTQQTAAVVSYVVAFVAIAAVVSLLGLLIQRIFEFIRLNFLNRLLGSIVSAGTVLLLLSILLNLVLMLDPLEKIIRPGVKQESFFYERVRRVVPAVVPYLNRDFWEEHVPEKYREQIEESGAGANLPARGQSIDSAFQDRYFKTDTLK